MEPQSVVELPESHLSQIATDAIDLVVAKKVSTVSGDVNLLSVGLRLV
ncbi:MAG: hypothetical protein LBF56_03770 [Holosporales bacterium]|jgi:hypothetical protein|nr:hypothetical protein [Holosporales bacterium]